MHGDPPRRPAFPGGQRRRAWPLPQIACGMQGVISVPLIAPKDFSQLVRLSRKGFCGGKDLEYRLIAGYELLFAEK